MDSTLLPCGVSVRFEKHVGIDWYNDLCYFLGMKAENCIFIVVDVCNGEYFTLDKGVRTDGISYMENKLNNFSWP